MAPSDPKDHNSDHTKVNEGTSGSYVEMGDWEYEPRRRSSYSSYGSYYGTNRGPEVHHHHHHYGNGKAYQEYISHSHNSQDTAEGLGFILCAGLFVGVVIVGFCVVKEMNRQKRVKENEAQVKVLSQAPSFQLADEQNPVLFQGPCNVDGPVSDPQFGIIT